MVQPAADAIDHSVGLAAELVVQPLGDQAARDLRAVRLTLDRVVPDRAFGSAAARCMTAMMSRRAPRSRSVRSASRARGRCAVSSSWASPICSRRCSRSIVLRRISPVRECHGQGIGCRWRRAWSASLRPEPCGGRRSSGTDRRALARASASSLCGRPSRGRPAVLGRRQRRVYIRARKWRGGTPKVRLKAVAKFAGLA